MATFASHFFQRKDLEDSKFIFLVRAKPLVQKIPTNPILAYIETKNDPVTLDYVKNDESMLGYFNAYTDLYPVHHKGGFTLIPHSSSYFGDPTMGPSSSKCLEIYEVEEEGELELTSSPPDF